jgi:tRNA (guanine-N7-)-methyltransferase
MDHVEFVLDDWPRTRPRCNGRRLMRIDPYAHAPRLPLDGTIDPCAIVGGGQIPVELEIGPGRGGFLFERVVAAPVALIGIEIRRKWATIVDERLRELGHGQRARVFAEDARGAIARFAEASFSAVYVHFPDPWWKKRHQKRLVVGYDFAKSLLRVLRPGGELFVQTDVEERAQSYHSLLESVEGFAPVESSAWVDENPYGARSSRERRAMADGLPIHRLRYHRRDVL